MIFNASSWTIPLLAIAETETKAPASTGIPIWISGLAIAALYGGLFYLWYAVKNQRGLGAWFAKQKNQKEIKWIETQGIAPRTSVVLVEVRGQSLVIVLSPHGVQVHPLQKNEDFGDALDLEEKPKEKVSDVKK